MREKLYKRKVWMILVWCIAAVIAICNAPHVVKAASDLTIEIPYVQNFVSNPEGADEDDTFTYTVSGDADMQFTLQGTTEGTLRLQETFQGPGYYQYNVEAVRAQGGSGYTYEDTAYIVDVMVINREEGLGIGAVVIRDGADRKYDAMEFDVAYNAPSRPVPEEPATEPVTAAEPETESPAVTEETTPAETAAEESTPAPDVMPVREGGTEPVSESAAPSETEEQSQTAPEEIIEETGPPLAVNEPGDDAGNYWALLNLLLMIATIILFIVVVILFFTKKKGKKAETQEDEAVNKSVNEETQDDEEDQRYSRKPVPRFLGVIPAAASAIVFFLTEDMRLPMRWVDRWTWLMAVILVVMIILAILSKVRKPKDDDSEQQPPESAEEQANAVESN